MGRGGGGGLGCCFSKPPGALWGIPMRTGTCRSLGSCTGVRSAQSPLLMGCPCWVPGHGCPPATPLCPWPPAWPSLQWMVCERPAWAASWQGCTSLFSGVVSLLGLLGRPTLGWGPQRLMEDP